MRARKVALLILITYACLIIFLIYKYGITHLFIIFNRIVHLAF